jgi:hypothetical protein
MSIAGADQASNTSARQGAHRAPRPPRRGARRAALGAVLVLALGVLMVGAGCNIVGPMGYLVAGPEKVKPIYTLDPTKVHLIFVDDRASLVPQRALRDTLGTTAEEELLNRKIVESMKQSRMAQAQVRGERFGRPMSVVELGKALEADVVIHVAIRAFTLTQDGASLSPLVAMDVRIVDVATEKQLFPPSGDKTDWFRVNTSLPTQVTALPTSSASQVQAMQDLALLAGRELARAFYEHEPEKGLRKLEDVRKP